MADETDNEQPDEQQAPEAAAPVKVERDLGSEIDQMRVALTQIAAALARPPVQQMRPVEPDLQELADRHGKPVDEFKAVDGLIGARIAPLVEEVKAIRAASELTLPDMTQTLMDEYGLTRGAAVHALVDAQDALGEGATNKRILSRAMAEAKKQAAPTPDTSHASVVRGGSVPQGRRSTVPEKKHDSFIDTIKKEQKRRGLYAY